MKPNEFRNQNHYYTLFILVLIFYSNTWLRNLIIENPTFVILNLAVFILLIICFFNKPKRYWFLILTILSVIILTWLQIKLTNINVEYEYTPAGKDLQLRRMNYYPGRLAHLGYILELKKETLLIYKIENNFFDSIDLTEYFPDYFSYLLVPLVLIGIYRFFSSNVSIEKLLFIVSVLTITLTGVHGKYGPTIIFPFINLFSFLGARALIIRKNAKNL